MYFNSQQRHLLEIVDYQIYVLFLTVPLLAEKAVPKVYIPSQVLRCEI